jgi:hypothetical protein
MNVLFGMLMGLLTATAALVVSFAVLGMGWVLSKAFPLSVFQGASLVVALMAMGLVAASLSRIAESLEGVRELLKSWLFEADAKAEEAPEPAVAPALEARKVQRHAPCPCGSGKKFSECHGQSSSTN